MSIFNDLKAKFFDSLERFGGSGESTNSAQANGADQTNEINSFWRKYAKNFGGGGSDSEQTNNAALHNLSSKVAVSQPKQIKNRVWSEGANKYGYDVTVSAKDVGLQQWGTVDPKLVTRRAMEKAVIKMGITSDEAKAKEIVGKLQINGLTTGSGENARPVKATDFAYRGWLQDRVDLRGNYAVRIPPEDLANILAASKEVLGADFKAPANVSKAQLGVWGIGLTGVGLTAGIAFKNAPLALGGGGSLAPFVLGGLAVAPPAIFTGMYVKEAIENGLSREREKILPPPKPPVLQIEDIGEAPPFARPTDTTEKQPNVSPIPGSETQKGQEMIPRPNVPPGTIAKPEIGNLPQPYTPDAPRNNEPPQQQQPPSRLPKLPKGVPEAIAAAGGAGVGKVAADALSSPVERTKPSLSPDAAREPRGFPEKIEPNEAPENVLAKIKQNESAVILSQAGYDVEQLKPNFKLGVAQPDFKIEGKAFDHYAPTSSNPRSIYATLKDKIEKGQANRFIVNLDDSSVSIEKLTDQFKNWKLDGLEEVILIKGTEITPFFPFDK